jgi:hypothetical protein
MQYPLRFHPINPRVGAVGSLIATTKIPHSLGQHRPLSSFKTHRLEGPLRRLSTTEF